MRFCRPAAVLIRMSPPILSRRVAPCISATGISTGSSAPSLGSWHPAPAFGSMALYGFWTAHDHGDHGGYSQTFWSVAATLLPYRPKSAVPDLTARLAMAHQLVAALGWAKPPSPAQVLWPRERTVAAARVEPDIQVLGKRRGYPPAAGVPFDRAASASALQSSLESVKSLCPTFNRFRKDSETIFFDSL